MFPPLFVDARRESAPSGERERRVEEEGSKAMEDELEKKSRPAKEPARPTLPMRSKSTSGRSALTRGAKREREMRHRR